MVPNSLMSEIFIERFHYNEDSKKKCGKPGFVAKTRENREKEDKLKLGT